MKKSFIEQITKLQTKFPGIELKRVQGVGKGMAFVYRWAVIVPEKYKEGHESHYASVTNNFLAYLKNKNMPAWEVPNMLAKYYTTTQALEVSLKNQK